MLRFFFRHYEPWVTHFVFFDDVSTDGTVEYLRSKPNVEVRARQYSETNSLVLSGKAIRDQCWKQSCGFADWVIVADVDEHLYHPNIEAYLARCTNDGITCVPALGYEMLTDDFPATTEHLASTRTLGAPASMYSKMLVFNPNAIEKMNFAVEAHTAAPSGRVVLPEKDELLLLHYKHLGMDYPFDRNNFLQRGLRSLDLQNRWGHQYAYDREQYMRIRQGIAEKMVDIGHPSYMPWRDYPEPRWWRNSPEGPAL